MISELNGQENYFTRICAGGLLNTRKLELAHMLLQDINMFHLHPHSMPISNSDNNRLISSTISNMTLNDKKMAKKLKAQSGSEMAQAGGSPRLVVNLIKSSSNLLLDSKSNPHSPLMQTKINTSKTETNVNRITTTTTTTAAASSSNSSSSTHYYYNHSQHQQDIAASNSEIKEAIESSIDDLASFTLYSSRKPLNVYQPIKDQFWVLN
jgi:hypothetical protein